MTAVSGRASVLMWNDKVTTPSDTQIEKWAAVVAESGSVPLWLPGRPKVPGLTNDFKPQPHQVAAYKQAWSEQNNGRLIVGHGPGLGKTATSIMFSEEALKRNPGKPVVIVTPDGMKTQYEQEGVEKFTNRDAYTIQTGKDAQLLASLKQSGKALPSYVIVGWTMLRTQAPLLASLQPAAIVADEAQSMRDPHSSNFKAFMTVRQATPHCALLTGSIVSNSPNDMVPLLHAVSGGEVPLNFNMKEAATVPVGRYQGLFGGPKDNRFVDNPLAVQHIAGRWINYKSNEDVGDAMPPATTEYVPVEMSDRQYQLYVDTLKGTAPPGMAERIATGQPIGSSNHATVFTRIMRARQAAQSTEALDGLTPEMLASSPKLGKIVGDLEEHLQADPRNRSVIYSNFIASGIQSMHYALKAKGIPHSIFVGAGTEVGDSEIDKVTRQRAVDDFKAGKTRVMLLSGAGKEGLDFRDTNMFQAMEGHFNPELIKQAQARVRRMKGLQNFEPHERRVIIKRYVSVEPNPGFIKKFMRKMRGQPEHFQTTDEWVYGVAKAKNLTNEGVRIALSGAIPVLPGREARPWGRTHKYLSRKWHPQREEWVYKYPKPL